MFIFNGTFHSQTTAKKIFNLGVKAYENGSFGSAKHCFEVAYLIDDSYQIAKYNAGNSAFLHGQFEDAQTVMLDGTLATGINTSLK